MGLASATARFPTFGAPLDATAVLRALAAHPASPLFEAANLTLALTVAKSQPAFWRSCMLETRLAAGSSRVDFMGCMADVDADRSLVRALPLSAEVGWDSAERVIRAWAESTPALERVPIVWLEWDLPGTQPRPPMCSLCLDAGLLDPRAKPLERREQRSIVEWLVTRSFAVEVAEKVLGGFSRCVDTLPPSARLMHVAPLLARELQRLRLTLGLLPGELCSWLRQIEWPGNVEEVERWLPLLAPPWQLTFFQVEMDDAVHPHLSIETRSQSGSAAKPVIPQRLLERLIECGMVDAPRAAAAQAWPGTLRTTLDGEPALLTRSAYAKLVLTAGVASELKAYLGVSRGA